VFTKHCLPLKTQNKRPKAFPAKNVIQINNVFTFGSKKLSIFLFACSQAYNFCRHFRSVQWWPVYQCLEFYLSIKNTDRYLATEWISKLKSKNIFHTKKAKKSIKFTWSRVSTARSVHVVILCSKMSQHQQNNSTWHMCHTRNKNNSWQSKEQRLCEQNYKKT